MRAKQEAIRIGTICLIILSSCVQKKGHRGASVLHTSYYEIGNVMRMDTSNVHATSRGKHGSELDSFLVDYEVVRKTDSLLTRECDWYCLKSLVEYNASANCSVFVDVPNTSFAFLNASVKRAITRYKDELFKKLQDASLNNDPFRMGAMNSSFSARLISAYEDSELISFCFSINEYLAGAPHENHFYHSFNYNKRQGKLITFNDLFSVETSADSTLLVALIKATIAEQGLDPFTVYEYDFNLNAEYVVFNFDGGEIAPFMFGSPRAALNRKALMARFGRDSIF